VEKFLGDPDELAVIVALALETLGVPYRYVLKGDGVTWYSVETVPIQTDP
jgi:hypothetical protein